RPETALERPGVVGRDDVDRRPARVAEGEAYGVRRLGLGGGQVRAERQGREDCGRAEPEKGVPGEEIAHGIPELRGAPARWRAGGTRKIRGRGAPDPGAGGEETHTR